MALILWNRRGARHPALSSHLGLLIGLILTVMAPVFSGWQNPLSGKDGLTSQLTQSLD